MVSRRLTAVSSLLAQDPGEGEALAGALREAVLNAVLHADYFSRGGLTIQRTAAELTVSNGGLLRVSPEQAQAGRAADPRNRGLIQLFSLVRLATGTGRGLHGIYALWARRGWQTPTLSQAFRTGVTQLSLPSRPRPSLRRSSPNGRSSPTSPTMSPPALRPWPRSSVCPTERYRRGWMPFWGGTWWSGRGEATVCGRNRGTRVPLFASSRFIKKSEASLSQGGFLRFVRSVDH